MATNGYGKSNKRKHTTTHPYARDKTKRTKSNNDNSSGSDQNGLFGSFFTTIKTFSQQWLTKAPATESDSEANESDYETEERQPSQNNTYWNTSSSNQFDTSQRYIESNTNNNNNNETRQSLNSLDDALQQIAAKGITQQEFERYMDILRRGVKDSHGTSTTVSPLTYPSKSPIIKPIPQHDPTNTSTDVVRSFIAKGQRPAPTQALSSSMYDMNSRPSSSSVLKRGRVVSPQQEPVSQPQLPSTDNTNTSSQFAEQEVYLDKQPPFKRRLLKTSAATPSQTASPVSVSEAAKRILVALDQVSSPMNAGIPGGLNTARKKENVAPVGNGSGARRPIISKTIVASPGAQRKVVADQMDEEAPPTEILSVPQEKKTKTRIQVSEYAQPAKETPKNGKGIHVEDEEEKLVTKPKKTPQAEPTKPKTIEVEQEKPRKQPEFSTVSAFPMTSSSPTFSFGAEDNKKKRSQEEEPESQKKGPMFSTSSPASIAASISDKIPQFSLPVSPPAVEKSAFSATSKLPTFDFQKEDDTKQTEQVDIRKKKRAALTSTPKMFSTGANPFSWLPEDESASTEADKPTFTPISFSTPESKSKEKPEKPQEQEEKKETPEPKTFAFDFGKKEEKKEEKKETEKPAISSPPPTFSFLSDAKKDDKKDEQKEKTAETTPVSAFTPISFTFAAEKKNEEKEKAETAAPVAASSSAFSSFKPIEEPEKPKPAEKEKTAETTPAVSFGTSGGFVFGSSASTTPAPTAEKKEDKPAEAAPGFSFGTVTAAPAATTTAPSFSLTPAPAAEKKTEEPKKTDAAPTFSFGTPASATAAPAASEKKDIPFVFGASSTPAASSTAASTGSTFVFGGTTPAASAATPAASSASTSFTFGATPAASTTPAADLSMEHDKPAASATTAPAFAFGSTPTTAATSTFNFGAPAPAAASASTTSDFVFGAAPTTSTTPAASFGASTTTPSFGTSSTSGPTFSFGSTPSAAPFGSSAASTTPAFGSTTSTSPSFGASTSTSSPFGAAPAAPFGSTPTTGAFGSTSAPSSTGAFGAPASFGSTSTPPAGAFGSTPPPFGATSSTTPSFGSSTTSTFGSTPSFGSAAPAFGSTPAAAPSPFGSTPASSFGSSSGFSFGAPAAPAAATATASDFVFGGAPAASSFGGAASFGASPAPAFGGAPSFGASTTPAPSFGAPAASPGQFAFGGTPSTPTSSFGGFGTDGGSGSFTGSGGFNIGSGGGDKGAGGRKIVQAKRTKGKKV